MVELASFANFAVCSHTLHFFARSPTLRTAFQQGGWMLKQQMYSLLLFFLVCLGVHLFEKREMMDDDAQTQILGPVMRALGVKHAYVSY